MSKDQNIIDQLKIAGQDIIDDLGMDAVKVAAKYRKRHDDYRMVVVAKEPSPDAIPEDVPDEVPTPTPEPGQTPDGTVPDYLPQPGNWWGDYRKLSLFRYEGETVFRGIKGTKDNAILIPGINTTDKLIIEDCEYCIFDSPIVHRGMQSSAVNISGGHHVALLNPQVRRGQTGISVGEIEDFVCIGGSVTDCGQWDYSGREDRDYHGWVIWGGKRIWIVGHESSRNEGDGIQINMEGRGSDVYIANCLFKNNNQTGVTAKAAERLIVAECHAEGNRAFNSSSTGAAFGYQYGIKDGWFLYNTGVDVESGFYFGSTSSGNFYQRPTGNIHAYLVGNITGNLHSPLSTNPNHYGRDVVARGSENIAVVDHRGQRGLSYTGGRTLFTANNQFSEPADPVVNIFSGEGTESPITMTDIRAAYKAAFGRELP